MPYNSETSQYERRSTTVIDATPDGDTVAVAIDVKLDQGIDDYVADINHHAANGRHYPATSVASDSRFLKQSPAGVVSWADGVVAADAALKDFSNVASGAIAPAKIAQDASHRFVTDAERTKLSGIATGAQVNADITKAEIEAKLTGNISTHSHTNSTPVGAVAFFGMNSAPTGWLKANGAAVSRTAYAALFAAIGTTFGVGDGSTTFELPDLRGEFIRGLDDGRGVDSGRTFGSVQQGQIKKHKHVIPYGEYANFYFGRTTNFGKLGSGISDSDNYWPHTNDGSDYDGTVNSPGAIGDETRPRNIALLPCIKY